jgi:hypothetical protein
VSFIRTRNVAANAPYEGPNVDAVLKTFDQCLLQRQFIKKPTLLPRYISLLSSSSILEILNAQATALKSHREESSKNH